MSQPLHDQGTPGPITTTTFTITTMVTRVQGANTSPCNWGHMIISSKSPKLCLCVEVNLINGRSVNTHGLSKLYLFTNHFTTDSFIQAGLFSVNEFRILVTYIYTTTNPWVSLSSGLRGISAGLTPPSSNLLSTPPVQAHKVILLLVLESYYMG